MKKKYIILFSVVIVYLVITFILLAVTGNIDGIGKKYIVLSPDIVLTYKNDNLSLYTKKIKKKNIELYYNNEYMGSYKFSYKDNEIQFIDKNKNTFETHDNQFFGYSKSLNIDIIPFENNQMNDLEIEKLNQILNNLGISGYEILSISDKINIDYNNDGINDDIYIVSNLFLESINKKVFSLIYYLDENSNPVFIYKNINNTTSMYNLCVPSINNIVDLNKDSNYEMFIECNYFDNIGTEYSIYKFENKSYNIIKGF